MATESYMERPLAYRLRKVARYVELYGISRTLVKVRGQYHMASKQGFDSPRWDNPGCPDPDASSRRIGLLGSGSFAYSNIAYYLYQIDPRLYPRCHGPRASSCTFAC